METVKISKRKKLMFPLRLLLALVAIALVAGGAILGKIKWEQGKMAPLETGEVVPGVFAVNNGFVNFYAIRGATGYLLVDSGNNERQTERELAKLGIDPADVLAILLTHSDSDHVAGLDLFPNGEVYLPLEEEVMVNGTVSRGFMGYNGVSQAYLALKDETRFSLDGLDIYCISTPGHTLGSMSYLIDDKYLFVGDTMSLKEGKARLFNSFYNMDDEAQKSSIGKLANRVQADFLFTGHYGYTGDVAWALAGWR